MDNPQDDSYDLSFSKDSVSQSSEVTQESEDAEESCNLYDSTEFVTDDEPPEIQREIVEYGIEDAANSDVNWIASTFFSKIRFANLI